MKIEKAKFGRFIIKDCVNCKTRLDYQVANLEIDGIRNYLCDNCLEELVFKINEHLDLNKKQFLLYKEEINMKISDKNVEKSLIKSNARINLCLRQ